MHYYEVAPNRIFRATSEVFTYSSEKPLRTGQIVTVEVGTRTVIGVVTSAVKKPAYPTKSINTTVDAAIPPQLILTAQWIARHYQTHLATVLQTILPQGVNKTRRARAESAIVPIRDRTHFLLNSNQHTALKEINEMSPGTAILHGVTGSGKTRVYIELARQAHRRGESTIMLVPEIALTSQLVDEFSAHFDSLILSHSTQTEAERHLAWQKALSNTPHVVIGPRSALFLPLQSIGFIIIDESHEPSYKQEQAPRYQTQRVASTLASHHRAKLILGSATPSITDYYLAVQNNRPIIKMPTPARSNSKAPTVQIVDMTKQSSAKNHRFLSNTLITQIEKSLSSNNQALVFHNRRGSALITLCESCGWTALCSRCHIPLTLHTDKHHMRCHTCGQTEAIPTSCPLCFNTNILHKGIGTKLVESELQKLFPNKKIARFDGDGTVGDTVAARYKEIYDGDIDILVGTQVIAKGLDLPKLRSVGIIQADIGLSMPDYGASERTFQLLAQVIGRVGRTEHETNVTIQTYQPSHPAIVHGVTQDYEGFYQNILADRKKAYFPPFCHLLKLTCTFKTEAVAIKNSQKLAAELQNHTKNQKLDVQLLGPAPAFYERKHDTYRWQIIAKSPTRSHLVEILKYVPPKYWQAELDPLSLL
jgi:primosomal protein N' (replication factor Y)